MSMQSERGTSPPTVIKGKPFQAQFEMVRSGKKKVPGDAMSPERVTGVIYRDSEGRERFEQHLDVAPGLTLKWIHLQDPVEKMTYMLEATSRVILRKEPMSEGGTFWTLSVGDVGIGLPSAPPKTQPDFESKDIEGLQCDGYQITVREGTTVEFWFSPDLTQLVLAKAVSGSEESTWRYFNFRFVEPDKSLFTIPADYTDASEAGGVEVEVPDSGTAGDPANEVKIKLLDSGATGEVQTSEDPDRAALFRAASRGNVVAVNELLAKGVDVNTTDHNNDTPLMRAATAGHTELVETLLAAGADVNAKGSIGKTALMHAAFSGHCDTVKALLTEGADVNTRTHYDQTALLLATYNGRSEIVDMLLAAGADVNLQDSYGNTPLIAAAGAGRVGIEQALLAHGADVNAKNNEGETPLKMAARFGHTDMIELLKKAGAHQ